MSQDDLSPLQDVQISIKQYMFHGYPMFQCSVQCTLSEGRKLTGVRVAWSGLDAMVKCVTHICSILTEVEAEQLFDLVLDRADQMP